MKKHFFTSIIGISTAFVMIASGCSGKSIDQIQNSSETTVTSFTEQTQGLITTIATAYTTDITTEPKLTSGVTITTIEPDISIVQSLLGKMTLEEKIYQMFIVTPEVLTNFNGSVTEAGDMTKSALEATPVGGIIYFSQNIESWQQTYDMLHNSQKYAQKSHNDIGLFLAVDEEGGSVARVGNNLKTYSSYDMESYGNKLDYDTVYNLGYTIGATLNDLGFNLNFAPVADINLNPDNELGNRIFSSDPQIVSEMTASFVKGVESNAVSATLKHFPGLGAGTGNTHNSSVLIERTYDELLYSEFTAFSGGIQAGADFVMVGHQITSASGDNLPGDLSPTVVTKWLKNDLGFIGLVVTDSQSMRAITENYSPGEAAVLSIKAGVDLILMPYDLDNAVAGIKNAIKSGELTEERINESVYKILEKKYSLGIIDIASSQTSTTTK